MKKGILFIFTVIIGISVFAQEEDKQEENQKDYYENEAKDRLVMGFTWDGWIHNVDSLETKWNSWGFHFYFMYDIPIAKSAFSFAPGIGLSGSWVKNNSWLDESNPDRTVMRPFADTIKRKRNSLVRLHFDIPVELRYRSKPNSKNKSFKLAIGAVAGVLMSDHTKLKTSDPVFSQGRGTTKIIKEYKYGDLARFKFGPTLRIGYGSINLYGFFNALKLFKNDQGPDVYPISVGLSINGL